MFGGVQHSQPGPSETEPHVLLDLGMPAASVESMALAWRANMEAGASHITMMLYFL